MACCASCALNRPCESNCPDHDHKTLTMGMTPDVAAALGAAAIAARDRANVVGADQSRIHDGIKWQPNTRVAVVYPEQSIVGMTPDAISACLAGACQRTRERVSVMGKALPGGRVIVTTPGSTRLPAAPVRPTAAVDGRWIPGRKPGAQPPAGYSYEGRKVGPRQEWRTVPQASAPPPRADVAPPPGTTCVGPWRNDAGPKPSNYQQIGAWWRSCYAYDAPSYNVSNTDGAYIDQIQALLGALSAMSDDVLIQTLTANPWVLDLLSDLGLLPQNAAVIGFDLSDFRKADDVFSNVWDAAKQYVPYGNVIDQVHQARRGLMYGDQARGPAKGGAAPVDPKTALVRRMQGIWRRRWKGDKAANMEVVRMKERAASGDPVAAREWAVYVAVSRDDVGRVQ